MKKIFALSLISGTQDFMKRRCLQEFLDEAGLRNWQVQTVSGDQTHEIQDALSSSVLFSAPTLLVITSPEKIKDVELLVAHGEEKQPDTRVVLFSGGKAKGSTSKIGKKFPKCHAVLDAPPFFKEGVAAIEFLIDEAKRYNKKLPENLAKGLVQLAGTDLGQLSFEIKKICYLADSFGHVEIESIHFAGVVARIGEVSVFPLLDAIGRRDLVTALRELGNIRRNEARDPTIQICRFLASTAYLWLGAASLLSQNVSPENANAAKRLGLNPFRYKKSILPVARRWGVADLISLLDVLSQSERAQRKGALSPWLFFTGKLIQLLGESRSGGT